MNLKDIMLSDIGSQKDKNDDSTHVRSLEQSKS